VKLRARTVRRDGFRTYNLSQWGNKVAKNRILTFTIKSSNVPEPYDVWWKVRNTGPEAIARNMIPARLSRTATVAAARSLRPSGANHFVEVYVIKNGVVVAKDHHPVIIT
jgi:hypothetical protein